MRAGAVKAAGKEDYLGKRGLIGLKGGFVRFDGCFEALISHFPVSY